jgi:hypothetical protein
MQCHAAREACGAEPFHRGVVRCHAAIVEDIGMAHATAIEQRHEPRELLDRERTRGDVHRTMRCERFFADCGGAIAFRDHHIAASCEHHIVPEPLRETEPKPVRVAEEAGPLA